MKTIYVVVKMVNIEEAFVNRESAEKYADMLERKTHENCEVAKVLRRK